MRPSADHRAEDDAARRAITGMLDQTLFVEAGAGTGKTSALVDRIVALVLAGRTVDRIVAITFTDKAAAELRDRVRTALDAVAREGTRSPDDRRFAEDALTALDRAQISTIHSFCLGLLRSCAAEAGIDPDFEVQDEVMAERRFEERWHLCLEALAADAEVVATVDRVLSLGLTTRDVANLARNLWQRPDLAPLLEENPLTAPPAVWPDLTALRDRLMSLSLAQVGPEDHLRVKAERVLSLVTRLAAATEDREALLAASSDVLDLKFGSDGRAHDWGGAQPIARVRGQARGVCDELSRFLESLRSVALASLLPRIVRFVVDDGRDRAREGRLVFDDLILRARDLLRDNAEARHTLAARVEALLIDEFQDTDPLQVEIALALAGDPDSGDLVPGRLFLVGDPKQSIYRFRRADMTVYSHTRRRVLGNATRPAAGVAVSLALNRRSRPQIIDWVNAVFVRCIGDGAAPELQPPYQDIHAEREADLAGPGAAWFGGELDLPARAVRELEATAIAAHILGAVESGWQVQERDGRSRPAGFRDIAVLVPTRAILLPLERALLDGGVPYRVEGGSLVYATQEVRDLINCLTAIDDPADEVAAVGALRSPAYACSDVEIAAFRLDGGRFDYLRADLDRRQGRVAEALQDLRIFHHRRHESSLAALVEAFVAASAVVEAGMLDQRNRNSFRRARFIIEQARAFEAAGPESLRNFVTWLERRAAAAILDKEGAGLDDDEDAVRVLTIHGAKGLEFPVVFVAGLGVSPRQETQVFGLDRATGEIAVSIGSRGRSARFDLGPVAGVNAVENLHLAAERDRLLYVAATRARDHLAISLFHMAGKRGTNANGAVRLVECGARDYAGELPAPPSNRPAVQLPPFGGLDMAPLPTLEEFEAERARLIGAAERLRVTSATALGPHLKAEASDESEPWARGRGGTHAGRAVHAALQSVAWDAAEAEIKAIARAQAVAEAIPERADEVARLVERALALPVAARARSARRVLREVPFAMTEGDTLVEGFIDAVVESSEGLEIVDWKTDDVSAGEVESRLAAYRLQAGLYVLGLERATGQVVSHLTYAFIRPGIEASPGDPATLAREALDALRVSE